MRFDILYGISWCLRRRAMERGKDLQVEECKLAGLATKFVDKPRSKIAAEDCSEIVIRDSLNDEIKANLIQKQLRESISKN
jgi:hypothetical protein